MREPWSNAVTGQRVILLPYRAAYVPLYHSWMEDAALREATASERLTLTEEFQMQREWKDDPQKATFIVFDIATAAGSSGGGSAAAISSAASALSADMGAAATAGDTRFSCCRGMIGDVNLFMLREDEARAMADAWRCKSSGAEASSSSSSSSSSETPSRAAEVMVMVADTAFRRRGAAAAAVLLMMQWGQRVLGIDIFVAKISEDNAASIALFTKRLGFVEATRVPAFGEVHLVLSLGAVPPVPCSCASQLEGHTDSCCSCEASSAELIPLPSTLCATDDEEGATLQRQLGLAR